MLLTCEKFSVDILIPLFLFFSFKKIYILCIEPLVPAFTSIGIISF